MKLTSQQESALCAVREFINDPDTTVFILRGYAGTGKTTMIQSIIHEVEPMRPHCKLMAPTGRAAKMLKERTGHNASTIHRAIYDLDKIEATDLDENGVPVGSPIQVDEVRRTEAKEIDRLHICFKIRTLDNEHAPDKCLCIVDEASMIPSIKSCEEMLHFGTDVLLDDLMTYLQPLKGGKVLFIGDPAQLPPVGDNKSAALCEQYFIDRGIKVCSAELTEVVRQAGESTILKNAMMIRDILNSKVRNSIEFEKGLDTVDINATGVAETYCNLVSSPCIGESVVICFSNSMVKDYNDAIRELYFPGATDIVAGDILQIVKNNVGVHDGIDLFNGDFVKVIAASNTTETLSAPVWADLGKDREKVHVSVTFRDVTLQLEDGTQVNCKIIDDLLNNRERGLNQLQILSLYINFKMRFNESVKHLNLTASTKEEMYYKALKRDPYYNAVQAKYGYAITAHKSQGGEWKYVFVDYTGRTGLNDDSLRWCYTATTRAIDTLYGINFPSATPLSKLVINPILKYSKPAKEAFSFCIQSNDSLLPESATPAQKAKLYCVKGNLSNRRVMIERIDLLQLVDRYHLQTPDGEVVVDCQYNGTGMYTNYRSQGQNPFLEEILECFRDESRMEFCTDYIPKANQMAVLFSTMLSICDDLDITITNIVEHSGQFYVAYYLKTSARFSQILFYFKNNGFITHAIPSSELGANDVKMTELIKKLNRDIAPSNDNKD